MSFDTDALIFLAAVTGFLLAVAVIKAVKRKNRAGKLTIEKEYLPGEYVPPSVVRTSDSDNLAKGIKYRYGSEAVQGDMPYIPNGVFCTPEMLHPEMPSNEMPSAEIPKGVMLDSFTKPYNSTFGGSTLQYRDSRGNYVYQNAGENNDNSFEKWAEVYRLNNSESAFIDDDEGFGSSTTSYTDYRGITHLIKNKKEDEKLPWEKT